MPSTKSTPQKPASSDRGRASKSGELKGDDLDKVTGGLKPIGGAYAGKSSPLSADPCEGGE
jgi:hypothetical protein